MSPLVMVAIVALRIATSWAASPAGIARMTPAVPSMARRRRLVVCIRASSSVETAFDEHVPDRRTTREQVVARDDDEVGELADLDRSYGGVDAEERRRSDGRRAKRVVGSHSGLD